jgi:hypothetical protein
MRLSGQATSGLILVRTPAEGGGSQDLWCVPEELGCWGPKRGIALVTGGFKFQL